MSHGMSDNWGDPEEARKRRREEFFDNINLNGFWKVCIWIADQQRWGVVSCPPSRNIAERDRKQLKEAGLCTAIEFVKVREANHCTIGDNLYGAPNRKKI